MLARVGQTALTARFHPLRLDYFERTGKAGIVFAYKGPDTGEKLTVVPSGVLFDSTDPVSLHDL